MTSVLPSDIYARLWPALEAVTGFLVFLILVSVVSCIVLAIGAGMATSGHTFRRPQWWIGVAVFAFMLLLVLLAEAILPHAPAIEGRTRV